jgi:DNA mismatch repair protein MutL
MTLTIHKLDRHTIDSIAAGEVIERPASVVKELLDNALDAGASVIRIKIENGGIRLISCEDDGRGMSSEDALMAIESHATSKLVTTDDLHELKTLGFRGEALPSIAAVSRLELRTRMREAVEGTRVVVEGGKLTFSGPCGLSPGTVVTCRDLFYNTPARSVTDWMTRPLTMKICRERLWREASGVVTNPETRTGGTSPATGTIAAATSGPNTA